MPPLSLYAQIKLGLLKVKQRGRHASPPEHRFWSQVDKQGPIHPTLGTRCWLWTGTRLHRGQGYGQIAVDRVRYMAHRYSWILHNGPIPEGLQACHHCDNKGCVNPKHLFLGTSQDNQDDKVAKGRQASGRRCGVYTHPESYPRGDQHWSHHKPERVPRGESQGNALLTNAQAGEIRRRHQQDPSNRNLRSMAREYKVDIRVVMGVVLGRTYRS